MSSPIEIHPVIKPVRMLFSGTKVVLCDNDRKLIEEYWEAQKTAGKTFSRGEVFVVTDVTDTTESLSVSVDLTDYAHYLATISPHVPKLDMPCRVMHTAVLLESSDHHLFMGEMNNHTSVPTRIQCVGGGITFEELNDDNSLEVERNARLEMLEEVGIDVTNQQMIQSFEFKYLKTGGRRGSIGAVYLTQLTMTKEEVLEHFKHYNQSLTQKGDSPEFSRLFSVPKEHQAIEQFINTHKHRMDEYLPPLLRAHGCNFN